MNELNQACEAFRALLEEQLARIEHMDSTKRHDAHESNTYAMMPERWNISAVM